MNRRWPPIIGLAGGIGAGKSTVAAAFRELGCAVIDADRIGHEVLRRPEVRDRVAETWGKGILGSDGEVDRRALAAIVFRPDGDRTEYDKLIALSHPALLAEVRRRLEELTADTAGSAGVVLDAALLYEAGLERLCDAVVFVEADPAVRLARVSAGRGWTADDLRRREAYQKSLDFKLEKADHRVDNSQSTGQTALRVREIYRKIVGGAEAGHTPAGLPTQ